MFYAELLFRGKPFLFRYAFLGTMIKSVLSYIYISTQQNEHCDWLIVFSRAPDQIQIYPARDTTARDLCMTKLKMAWPSDVLTIVSLIDGDGPL